MSEFYPGLKFRLDHMFQNLFDFMKKFIIQMVGNRKSQNNYIKKIFCYKKMIFSLFLLSILGSRDKCLAFWQVPHIKDADDVSCYDVVKPIQTIEGNKSLDKVRAMVYNPFSEVSLFMIVYK